LLGSGEAGLKKACTDYSISNSVICMYTCTWKIRNWLFVRICTRVTGRYSYIILSRDCKWWQWCTAI